MRVVLPKTTFEQRQSIYQDVDALIDFGFLSHSVSINGMPMALRSLGPGDLFLLRHRVNSKLDDEWKVWTVASSLWMVNGHCLLGSTWAIPRLVRGIRRMPRHAREILFSLAMGLFNRQNRAIDATEAFCYESLSRYKWKAFGKHLPAAHAGVPGIEHLGTNHVQRMWSFFNTIEDQRLQEEAAWEGFKLSVSPHAPKGIKKIDERDRQARQQELARRQGVQDRTYYTIKGLLEALPEDKKNKEINLSESKSADDLVDEMHRWVSGEEDWHDQIVNSYKVRIVQNYEKQKAEQEQRAAALRAMQEQESDRPVSLVGYTPEQLAEILKDRRPGAAGVRQVGGGMNTVRDYLYQKYLGRTPDSGALRPNDDGGLEVVSEDDTPLNDRISQRQVLFASVPEEGEQAEPEVLSNEW